MVKDRTTCVLYTCGTCNLQCRYCGIDKNPALVEVDKVLEESFKGDYYFNRIKKYFPNRGQLKTIETWGGEPFLHMERIHPLLHQVIQYYPYFEGMFSSTNFSYTTWTEKVFGLFDVFKQYAYRNFTYCLQLSCDGPEYINDYGRGQGTTKKCLNNFNKFVELMPDCMAGNVDLTLTLKPTLDNNAIKLLCDKQRLIEYYQFFEDNFIDKIVVANYDNVHMNPGIPNTAVPSPVTKEEGEIFANLIRISKEIEEENAYKRYFKYYNIITPYYNNNCNNCLSYRYGFSNCGTGSSMVGLLPNNKVTICHEGFTHLAEDYKQYCITSKRLETGTINFDAYLEEQRTKYCLSDEEYENYEQIMTYWNNSETSARLINLTSQIMILAMANQINPIYAEEKNALKAAIFIQEHTAYCIKDNINETGSMTLMPIGLIKLLLNGAMEQIQVEGELKVEPINN